MDVVHPICNDHPATPENRNGDTHVENTLTQNIYIGDTLSLPKDVNTTRIYCQNVNGITLSALGTWDITCEHIRDMEVDIALFMEHKLNTSQPKVMQQLYADARNIFGLGTFTINATSTPIPSPTTYKPGGVLSLTTGDIKGRVLESGQDPFGCWVFTKLRRNTGPPITIVATYQVVEVDPRRSGPTTYATQLFSLYTRQGRLNPEKLRNHHADDLVGFIKTCQTKGEWVIVAGDLNEVLGRNTRGLTRLHSECGLVDAALDQHGLTDFTTYQRGHHVIDYLLVDHNVLQCVKASGYEPFNIHILSNHRGLYIDVSTSHCFGSSILPLQPIQLRDLSTKRSHQIAPYFATKEEHLSDHNWFDKISQLRHHMLDDTPNHELAEDLYNRLISSAVHAGTKLKRFPPTPYSPTIA